VSTNDTALAIWTPEEVTTIRSVIAPGLTEPEFLFFAQVCRAAGLNPIMNQIHAIKRKDSKAPSGHKLTIQTSIHGLRLIADRTKCYAPGREPTFVTNGKAIESATAYVKKYAGGQWHEVADTAYWAEYVQTYQSGDPVALWATKPHVMLAKCAEALALRRAFPAEMAGLYTDDEMPAQEPTLAPTVTEVVASTVAVIGGADPRKADTPRPVTAAEMSGRREPAPINPDAPTEAQMRKLHATARDHNWTPDAVKEVMRDLWQIDSSKALTKYQCGLLIDLIEDRMALTYDATGKARLGTAGPALTDDGKLSLDELPFDPAPVAADN
jgi:phage recombination protein Bet